MAANPVDMPIPRVVKWCACPRQTSLRCSKRSRLLFCFPVGDEGCIQTYIENCISIQHVTGSGYLVNEVLRTFYAKASYSNGRGVHAETSRGRSLNENTVCDSSPGPPSRRNWAGLFRERVRVCMPQLSAGRDRSPRRRQMLAFRARSPFALCASERVRHLVLQLLPGVCNIADDRRHCAKDPDAWWTQSGL